MRGSGPRTRRLRSILRRRERTTLERRPALDARGLGVLARPLAIVYTDTDDFTHRAARDGILHFLMCFDRALRHLRPGIARHRGRVVKVEADSLMLAFPDAPSACRGVLAMEQALRRLNRGRPTNEQLAFSYGIGFGQVLELEDDVFGLEVNLASKLGEDLARPGEVLLAVRGRDPPRPAAKAPRPVRTGRLRRKPDAGPAAAAAPMTRSRPMTRRTLAATCLGSAMLAAAGLAAVATAGAALRPGQAPPAPTPMERITLPGSPPRVAEPSRVLSRGLDQRPAGKGPRRLDARALARHRHPRPAAVVGRSRHRPPRLRWPGRPRGSATTGRWAMRRSTSSGASRPSKARTSTTAASSPAPRSTSPCGTRPRWASRGAFSSGRRRSTAW